MICVVDYGAGNLASVRNVFDQLGQSIDVVTRPEDLGRYSRLILPGVGSFRRAMETLESRGWTAPIRAFADEGKPVLGICLGMQLLFDAGEEHGETPGLGLIPGRVTLMEPAPPHRVPHVGWNNLIPARDHALLRGVKQHVDYYFVHSYHCVPRDESAVIARCDYGGEFVAVAGRDNVVGTQFHPEKSQPSGLRLLENFLEWDGTC